MVDMRFSTIFIAYDINSCAHPPSLRWMDKTFKSLIVLLASDEVMHRSDLTTGIGKFCEGFVGLCKFDKFGFGLTRIGYFL